MYTCTLSHLGHWDSTCRYLISCLKRSKTSVFLTFFFIWRSSPSCGTSSLEPEKMRLLLEGIWLLWLVIPCRYFLMTSCFYGWSNWTILSNTCCLKFSLPSPSSFLSLQDNNMSNDFPILSMRFPSINLKFQFSQLLNLQFSWWFAMIFNDFPTIFQPRLMTRWSLRSQAHVQSRACLALAEAGPEAAVPLRGFVGISGIYQRLWESMYVYIQYMYVYCIRIVYIYIYVYVYIFVFVYIFI